MNDDDSDTILYELFWEIDTGARTITKTFLVQQVTATDTATALSSGIYHCTEGDVPGDGGTLSGSESGETTLSGGGISAVLTVQGDTLTVNYEDGALVHTFSIQDSGSLGTIVEDSSFCPSLVSLAN